MGASSYKSYAASNVDDIENGGHGSKLEFLENPGIPPDLYTGYLRSLNVFLLQLRVKDTTSS
jgi:hypothetical protein